MATVSSFSGWCQLWNVMQRNLVSQRHRDGHRLGFHYSYLFYSSSSPAYSCSCSSGLFEICQSVSFPQRCSLRMLKGEQRHQTMPRTRARTIHSRVVSQRTIGIIQIPRSDPSTRPAPGCKTYLFLIGRVPAAGGCGGEGSGNRFGV